MRVAAVRRTIRDAPGPVSSAGAAPGAQTATSQAASAVRIHLRMRLSDTLHPGEPRSLAGPGREHFPIIWNRKMLPESLLCRVFEPAKRLGRVVLHTSP